MFTITITVRCVTPGRVGEIAEHQVYNQHREWTRGDAISFLARCENPSEWGYHSHRSDA